MGNTSPMADTYYTLVVIYPTFLCGTNNSFNPVNVSVCVRLWFWPQAV